MRRLYSNFPWLLAITSAFAIAIPSQAQQIDVPTNRVVAAPATTAGAGLKGEYWKRPPVSLPTDGITNPTNRIDNLVKTFGPADGTFNATRLSYTGNDLTPIGTWLTNDFPSFVGNTNNLDDGAIRLRGYLNVTNVGILRLGTTSDDGSRITLGGIDIINNDGSHGDVTIDTNVNFSAVGLYPIEVTFFNGDWTSDGTGTNLNHSGNPDPAVHGGANFHLRVGGATVTTNTARLFHATAPVIAVPANLAAAAPATNTGTGLRGEYWKRPPVSIPTDGATNPITRIDNLVKTFGPADGTFNATRLSYTGNDLTPILTWLTNDAPSFVGNTNHLDDGAVRFKGYINITDIGNVRLGTTSDDGSRITIGGVDIINNDGSHGDVTMDTNVNFSAVGLYPIEVTFFNGDWTSDGTGANLNHSGNPDPAVHGGANFHLRVGGATVTTNTVVLFHTPDVIPQVGITRSGINVLISFPAGYRLQTTPTLTPPAWTDVTGATSPHSVQITGQAAFFRAISP